MYQLWLCECFLASIQGKDFVFFLGDEALPFLPRDLQLIRSNTNHTWAMVGVNSFPKNPSSEIHGEEDQVASSGTNIALAIPSWPESVRSCAFNEDDRVEAITSF